MGAAAGSEPVWDPQRSHEVSVHGPRPEQLSRPAASWQRRHRRWTGPPVGRPGWSQPGRPSLTECGQPVPQTGGLVGRQSGDPSVRRGLRPCGAAPSRARSDAPAGPEVTSTNCMRPYGTTVNSRKSTPWVTSRSSSRSAYRQERQLRPSISQPHSQQSQRQQREPPSPRPASPARQHPMPRPTATRPVHNKKTASPRQHGRQPRPDRFVLTPSLGADHLVHRAAIPSGGIVRTDWP